MSWEMIRYLKKMKDLYLLIRNMCLKSEKTEELREGLEEILPRHLFFICTYNNILKDV